MNDHVSKIKQQESENARLESQIAKLKNNNRLLKDTINAIYESASLAQTSANIDLRIDELARDLHKANMEINRLVIENQEKDYEIFRLKRLLGELYDTKT